MTKSSGSPNAPTAIRPAGSRRSTNAASANTQRTKTTRNSVRSRGGSCGNSELASDGRSTCSPGAAPNHLMRSHSGPSPRCGPCSHRTARRTRRPERRLRIPGSAGWVRPGRRIRVRCSSGRLLENEDVPDEVIDVGRAEPADQVVARPGAVDRVSAQHHVTKARQPRTAPEPSRGRSPEECCPPAGASVYAVRSQVTTPSGLNTLVA
jgi:hypothetical protein